MIGSTLSHYVIDEQIGEGGMGAVYRAHDTLLGRTVAIKVLTSAAANDPDLAGRLLREAKAASSLNHPNIVTIHEVARDGEVEFIVMERVDGQPLSRLIAPGGLPIDAVIDYFSQIASALAAAHDAGIVHRDVKPANVLVTRSGHVKVVDFGIARRLLRPKDAIAVTETVDSPPTTRPGTSMGTVGYMAPEQIEGKPADARSDVFSLGVVVYELLTGQRPFTGDSVWAVMAATIGHEIPSVAKARTETPPELARIVTRCLARRPDDRYSSGTELVADLTRLRERLAKTSSGVSGRRYSRMAIAAAVIVGLLGTGAFVWSRVHESRLRWVREKAIPEIMRLQEQQDYDSAYRLAKDALKVAPDDSQLKQEWINLTGGEATVSSDPPGAEVAFRGYLGQDKEWIALGTTPTGPVRIPFAPTRWRVTKPGYDVLESAPEDPSETPFKLVASGTAPPGMVFVPGGPSNLESTSDNVEIPDYWIDKYEVTNRQFKEFVDRGGYRNRTYWKEPFVKNGRALTWDDAMTGFRDTTGRPGPSTWELGAYPEGQDDFPVTGVSWYEAAAYAAFASRSLPTAYHWYRASGAFGLFSDILKASNFSGRGPARVGSLGGIGPYGTYDMAGNAKEWCWNAARGGRRYILGGAWYDPTYQFQGEDAQPPFDRPAGFGFRSVLQRAPMADRLTRAIETLERSPESLKPVSDDVFNVYVHLYDYDKTPLQATLDATDDSNPLWRRELVSFAAAYGNERLPVFLFLPKNAAPPLQTVVYFPGSNAVIEHSSRDLELREADFFVRSGRALVYPVYKGTYERFLSGPRGPAVLRDLMIQRGKDIRRAIDYLETRRDIDASRIAYHGLSLGACFAPLFLTIEPRFKAATLLSGGFETWNMPAEADPVNFTPHVKVPVLMVNGREDFDLPYETAQIPMFQMLGTPAADKRHAVFEGGHVPLRLQEPVKEMLDWLDRYLGPVKLK